MLKKIIDKLDRYRQKKSAWSELAWVRDESSEDYKDKNEDKRTEVLIALQFDKKKEDEEFIQFLMTEEIKNNSNDPFQGCSGNLDRVGYLLAGFRNPLNVDLFLQAKTANFDTDCGFDWEHILSAGVGKTFAQIERSPTDIREIFHSYFESLENCELTEKDIENWLDNKANIWYPSNPNELNKEYLINLALELNELSVARELIDDFESGMEVKEASMLTLKYYRGRLNDYKSQISLAERLLDFPKEDDLRAYDFIEIAQLYLKLDEVEQSWSSIKRAIMMRNNLDKGRLGQIADMCIEIVNHNDSKYNFLQECYKFGVENLGHFQSLEQAKKKLKAAVKMKDKGTAKYFKTFVKQEQARIDMLMKQLK